jgi:hypothetical protein
MTDWQAFLTLFFFFIAIVAMVDRFLALVGIGGDVCFKVVVSFVMAYLLISRKRESE